MDGSSKDQCEELFARFMPFPHLCSGHGQIDLWACFMMDHPGIVILECAWQGEVCLSKHLQWWLFVSRKQPLMDFEAKTLSSEHQVELLTLDWFVFVDSCQSLMTMETSMSGAGRKGHGSQFFLQLFYPGEITWIRVQRCGERYFAASAGRKFSLLGLFSLLLPTPFCK